MLNITLDLDTGLAKLASATTIISGTQVPVTITTVRGTANATPGASPAWELGIVTDASPAVLMAYLATFNAENDHTFTGTLNANDERLVTFMIGKGSVNCGCEVTWTVAGSLQAAQLTVPVKPRGIPSDPTSEGGPSYYTASQVDTAIAAEAAIARAAESANSAAITAEATARAAAIAGLGVPLAIIAEGQLGGWTSIDVAQPAQLWFPLGGGMIPGIWELLSAIPTGTDATAWNGSITVSRPGGTVVMGITGTVTEAPSAFDGDTLLLSLHDDLTGNLNYNQSQPDLLCIAEWLGYPQPTFAGDVMGVTCSDPNLNTRDLKLTTDATGAAQAISFSGTGSVASFAGEATGSDASSPTGQTQFVVLKSAPEDTANCWVPRWPAVLGYAWGQAGWNGTIRIGYTADGTTMYAPLLTISPQTDHDGPFVLAANSPAWNEYSGYGRGQPAMALCAEFVPATDVAADFSGGGVYLFLTLDEVLSNW